MAEKEKYAIINQQELVKLFTRSCTSRQTTGLHNIDIKQCSLIKSRHIGNGRDRLLIVKNRSGRPKHTNPAQAKAPIIITPITQVTEQAKSSLLKEGLEIKDDSNTKTVILNSSEGVPMKEHLDETVLQPYTITHLKRKPVSPSKVKAKKRKITIKQKHIKDLLS